MFVLCRFYGEEERKKERKKMRRIFDFPLCPFPSNIHTHTHAHVYDAKPKQYSRLDDTRSNFGIRREARRRESERNHLGWKNPVEMWIISRGL